MTFLELVQELQERCGVVGTSVSTVVAQDGENQRLVNWINNAWLDVQRRHKWNFLYSDVSFQTQSGTYIYTNGAAGAGSTGVEDLGKFDMDSFRCYVTADGQDGEHYMTDVPYDWFRDTYEFGNGLNLSGKPYIISCRRSDRALLLGPNPDAIHTVYGKFWKMAEKMTVADASTPTGLPEELHMMIVYKAMVKYGMYEAAPEVVQEGRDEYASMLKQAQDIILDDIEPWQPLA